MSIFIKAGLWLEKKTGYKGEFNLTRYITDLIASTPSVAPGLQEVLDVGTYAEFDGGNSSVAIMQGTFNNRNTYFDHASNTQSSGFEAGPLRFQAQNFVNGQSVAQLRFQEGEVQLSRTNLSVSSVPKSTLKIDLPTNNINFILPAKSVDGNYIVATLDDIPTRPYKVYTALLSQSGITAPLATVLENTLGFNLPLWVYNFAGNYSVYVPALNIPNKIALFIGQTGWNDSTFHFYQQGNDLYLDTRNRLTDRADDLITFPVSIEIRVYS